MVDKIKLRNFLIKAKKNTYAAGDSAKKIINNDKSTTLVFQNGDWKYHDNYFGGEPYGGREVVFFKEQPVYIMVYYGSVNNSIDNVKYVYHFLMGALSDIIEDNPYRGPKKFNEGNLSYKNNSHGDIDNFHGEEFILENGKEIYRAKYIGGFVDVR